MTLVRIVPTSSNVAIAPIVKIIFVFIRDLRSEKLLPANDAAIKQKKGKAK